MHSHDRTPAAGITDIGGALGVSGVQALFTDRFGGCSREPFAAPDGSGGLNLGDHCGDAWASVEENRRRLAERLPSAPLWLRQVHGKRVVSTEEGRGPFEADGIVSRRKGSVCAVMTADCLPVLFAHRHRSVVGAAHAGWRGLNAGILEATVDAMAVLPSDIVAFLGPAIGPTVYQVGDDVRDAFVSRDAGAAAGFTANGPGKWLADLYLLATRRLRAAGLTDIVGGGYCTLTQHRFYSFRRDGVTGRFASMIWLSEEED